MHHRAGMTDDLTTPNLPGVGRHGGGDRSHIVLIASNAVVLMDAASIVRDAFPAARVDPGRTLDEATQWIDGQGDGPLVILIGPPPDCDPTPLARAIAVRDGLLIVLGDTPLTERPACRTLHGALPFTEPLLRHLLDRAARGEGDVPEADGPG